MENERLWAGLKAMISPLEGSQAAPWLLWNVESSPEPRAAWYQGWLGELCHYKDGTFNMLRDSAAGSNPAAEFRRPDVDGEAELGNAVAAGRRVVV